MSEGESIETQAPSEAFARNFRLAFAKDDQDAETLLRTLREELSFEVDPARKARLHYEIAALLLRYRLEAQATKELVQAWNLDAQFRAPIETLIALFELKPTAKNLDKLYEALARSSSDPTEQRFAELRILLLRDFNDDALGPLNCLPACAGTRISRIEYHYLGARADARRSVRYDVRNERVTGTIDENLLHGGFRATIDETIAPDRKHTIVEYALALRERSCLPMRDPTHETISVLFRDGHRVNLHAQGGRSARCVAISPAEQARILQPFRTLVDEVIARRRANS